MSKSDLKVDIQMKQQIYFLIKLKQIIRYISLTKTRIVITNNSLFFTLNATLRRKSKSISLFCSLGVLRGVGVLISLTGGSRDTCVTAVGGGGMRIRLKYVKGRVRWEQQQHQQTIWHYLEVQSSTLKWNKLKHE